MTTAQKCHENGSSTSVRRVSALAPRQHHIENVHIMNSEILSPSALRTAILTSNEESRATVMRTARLLAAFYLDYPLFTPKASNTYPTLFLWSQMKKDECPPGCSSLIREDVGRHLPPEYGPRTPAVLFVHCGSFLEAILYCDHFSDLRSSLVMRILVDQVCNLNLTTSFFEDLRTQQLQRQVQLALTGERTHVASLALGQRYVQSMLELEILYETDDLQKMQMFIVSQLEVLFAQLPLQVQDTSVLPRLPVYCYQANKDDSLECRIHSTMHCYLQTLLISLQKTNRLSIEVNRIHDLLSDGASAKSSSSQLMCALLLVLRTIYRDLFSLAVNENWDHLPNVASRYNALITSMNNSEDVNQLKPWLSLASTQDLEHITRFLAFISENFPEKNDLPPLTCLTRSIWQQAMMPKHGQSLGRTDWLCGVVTPKFTASRFIYDKMTFIATDWTLPLSLDSSLIPMLLHLQPIDLCSSTSAPPDRSSMSARPTASLTLTKEAERVFSPRVDVIAVYAARGRKIMEKQEKSRERFSDEKKIRSICSRLKQKLNTQRSLEEDINEERSFVESLSSHNSTNGTELGAPKREVIQTSQKNDIQLKCSAKAFNKELVLLDKELDKIQQKLMIKSYVSVGNSVINDSQRTEEALNGGSEVDEDRVTEELEPLPLHYEETGPTLNSLPEMERLDFSLLSPEVDTGRKNDGEFFMEKSEKGVHARPDWMKLIPLDETNSNRFPLLQCNHLRRKESKTERSTQTTHSASVSSRQIVEKGCQTKEDEWIPPDSGFLDTLERTPRKKVEMIQPMSKKKIEEMLSQM